MINEVEVQGQAQLGKRYLPGHEVGYIHVLDSSTMLSQWRLDCFDIASSVQRLAVARNTVELCPSTCGR